MDKKIVILSQCLMIDRTRELNHMTQDYALENYDVDLMVINDQGFLPSDYKETEKILYIGGHKEAIGFINSRNQLLNWFYDSDYDWAVWLDSNIKVSKSALNDFASIVDAIRNDKVEVDCIASTMAKYIVDIRMEARKKEEHLENIFLVPMVDGNDSGWMAGLFMRNFNKYYGIRPLTNEKCNNVKGTQEDLYFVALCRKIFEYRLCPTMMIDLPPSTTSTWRTAETGYRGPVIRWELINRMVKNAGFKSFKKGLKPTIMLPRVEFMKDKVTPYKPRKEKEVEGLI